MNNNLYFNRHHPQRECRAKHAETIKKSTSLRTSARSFTPSPRPHVSAFDQTPSPRLCGHPLWTAPYCSNLQWQGAQVTTAMEGRSNLLLKGVQICNRWELR